MKKTANKLLAFAAFALAMVIGIGSAQASVCKIGDTEYATLQAAVAAVPANGTATITMTANVTLTAEGASGYATGYVKIDSNKNITLDLADYTITKPTTLYSGPGVLSVESATLTIKGNANGAIDASKKCKGGGTPVATIRVTTDGVLTVRGGTITGYECAVYTDRTGSVNIEGGELKGRSYGLMLRGNGPSMVSGGTVWGIYNGGYSSNAADGVNANSVLTISGGTIKHRQNPSLYENVIINYGTITISGGMFTNDGYSDPYGLSSVTEMIDNNGTLTITGGTFASMDGTPCIANTTSSRKTYDGSTGSSSTAATEFTGTTQISGGTFNTNPSDLLASDYKAQANGTDPETWTIVKAANPVAQVTIGGVTTKYSDLNAALTAAKVSGAVCELLSDVALSGEWTPIADFNGTFDGKGYTITGLTITAEKKNLLGLFADAGTDATIKNVTIKDATITATGGEKVGVLAGAISGSSISDVKVINATINTTSKYVGGLCGYGYPASCKCEVASCSVTGKDQVGGLIGYLWVGHIENSYVTNNTVIATEERAGGLVGKIQIAAGNLGNSTMWVNGNVVSGTATAPDMAGGLFAQIMGDVDYYDIRNNDIDVVLNAPKTSPIGILRPLNDGINVAFTGVLEENITGTTWSDATTNANSYVYAAELTGSGEKVINRDNPSVIVDTGDVEENPAKVVTKKSTAKAQTTSLTEDVATALAEQVTVEGKTTTISEQIEQTTKVEGVKLTTNETVVVAQELPAVSGPQAVVSAAKVQAVTEENATFTEKIATAKTVEVKVEVKVIPTAFVKPVAEQTVAEVAFKLEPKATVKVIENNEAVATQVVDVDNEMIDQTQPITVSIFTGFNPVQIVHHDDEGTFIEAFSGDTIAYDETTGIATVGISHFSILTAYDAEVVDPLQPVGSTKISSGFYQNAATYEASTEFYITNLDGLKKFRDFTNGEISDENYLGTYTDNLTDENKRQILSNGSAFNSRTVFLLADVDLNNEAWTPAAYYHSKTIGGAEAKVGFAGLFDAGIYDANGALTGTHTISNLKIESSTSTSSKDYYIGFIGRIATAGAGIKNVTFDNVNVSGYDYVAAVLGNGSKAGVIVDNCHVTGNVTISATKFVGGIVGHAAAASIYNCSIDGTGSIGATAETGYAVGGIAGYCYASITNCSIAGVNVLAGSNAAGGIVGCGSKDTVVSGCSLSDMSVSSPSETKTGIVVGRVDNEGAAEYLLVKGTTIGDNVSATAAGVDYDKQCCTHNADVAIVCCQSDIVGERTAGGITGGTYENIPESAIADGYELVAQGTTPETYGVQEVKTYVAQIGDVKYTSLADAIADVEAGTPTTIEMLSDVEYSNTGYAEGAAIITIPSGKEITLELNGKTISCDDTFNAALDLIRVWGDLTIQDTSAGKTGKIMMNSQNGWIANYAVNLIWVGSDGTAASKGKLTIQSGTFSISTPSSAYAAYVICASNNTGDSTVIINGGTFIGTKVDGVVRLHDQVHNPKINVTINGGDFTLVNGSDSVIWLDVQTSSGYTVNDSDVDLTITGGTFTSDMNPVLDIGHSVDAPNISVTISGGQFSGEGSMLNTRKLSDTSIANIQLSGGIYSGNTYYNTDTQATVSLNTICASGYELAYDAETGKYTVVESTPIAQVTIGGVTTNYSDLHKALEAAAVDGAVCELLSDVTLTGTWAPIADFAGTFDGKGYTISGLNLVEPDPLYEDSDGNKIEARLGLFAFINAGVVKNVTIAGATVTSTTSGAKNIGVLAGSAYGGASNEGFVSNVTVTAASVDSIGKYVGGLIGNDYTRIFDSQILNSTVKGKDQVGGVSGFKWCGCIEGCTVTGINVTATEERAGGLVGKAQFYDGNDSPMWLNDNVVSGTASGADKAGGLVAQIMCDDEEDDSDSYEIRNNTIDMTLTSETEVNPIGVLRDNQGPDFCAALSTKITGNWWTDATLNANSFQYTNVASGVDPQTIYRGVAMIGDTCYKTLQAAVDAAAEGDTIKILVDEIDLSCVKANVNYEGLVDSDGKPATSASGLETYSGATVYQISGCTLKNFVFTTPIYKKHIDGTTFDNCKFAGTGTAGADLEGTALKYMYLDENGTTLITNCVFAQTGKYAIHFDEGGAGSKVLVVDSTVTGTIAVGSVVEITFRNCYMAGKGVCTKCNMNIYTKASFEDCVFAQDYTSGSARGLLTVGSTTLVMVDGCSVDAGEGTLYDIVRADQLEGVVAFDGTKDDNGKYTDGIFMALAAASVNQFAAEGYEAKAHETIANGWTLEQTVTYVAQIGETKYETLAAAIKAAESGDTIEVLDGTWGADAIGTLTTQEALVVRYKSLTIQPATGATPKFTATVYLGYDDSSTANATMTVKGLAFEDASLILSNYVQADVEDCSFTFSSGNNQVNTSGALVVLDSCCTSHKSTGDYPTSQVTIKNCSINGSPWSYNTTKAQWEPQGALRIRNSGNVTVENNTIVNSNQNGITFESNEWIDDTVAKTVTVTGNKITEWNVDNNTDGGRGIRLSLTNTGTLADGSSVTVENNKFTKATLNLDSPDFVKITGAGGTTSLESNDWNNELRSTVSENTKYYTVNGSAPAIATVITTKEEPIVAKVGEVTFIDLEEAVNCAVTGSIKTVTLIANVDLTKYAEDACHVINADGVTLDLDIYTITVNNFGVVWQGDNMTIKNGAFVAANGGSYAIFVGDTRATEGVILDTVTCTGGINIYNSQVTIRSTSALGVSGSNYYAVWADEYADVLIENGTFVSQGDKPAILAHTGDEKAATLVVTGGSYSTDPSAYAADGLVAVYADGCWTVVKEAFTVTFAYGDDETTLAARDGYETAAPSAMTIYKEKAWELPTITAGTDYDGDNYTFLGWEDEHGYTVRKEIKAGDAITETLYAKFSKVAKASDSQPIVVSTNGTDVAETKVTIKVTEQWVKDNVDSSGKAEAEVINNKLEEVDSNGLKKWQNYVLGTKEYDGIATNVISDAAQTDDATKIAVVPNINPKDNTGFTIKYELQEVSGAAPITTVEASKIDDLQIDLTMIDKSAKFKVNVVLTPEGAENGEKIASTNTIGVLKAAATVNKTLIAVPWAGLDGKQVTVANLLKTANLTEGDKLYVYSDVVEDYFEWDLDADKIWQPVAKGYVGYDDPISGGPAAEYPLKRGVALWIDRADTSSPLVFFGGDVDEATADAELKGESEIVAPEEDETESWNLIASPMIEDLDLNTGKLNGVGEGAIIPTVGDKIQIPTDTTPINYTYRSNGKWQYQKKVKVTGGIYKVWVDADTPIAAGEGFFYLNKAGDKKISW